MTTQTLDSPDARLHYAEVMYAAAQPDAAQEFVMQFKKTLLPYLVQALDPKLLERGNEGALKKRIEELVDERLTTDKVPIGRQLRVKLLGDIIDEMVGFGPLEQLLRRVWRPVRRAGS